MRGEFWPGAWKLERSLSRARPDSPAGRRAIRQLQELSYQDYLFRHRQWADVRWLHALDEAGVLDDPPEPREVEDGFVAQRWPTVFFLKAAASDEPDRVVEILRRITTRNWWVISDVLSVAAELPPKACASLVTHFLPQWDEVAVQWVQRGVWRGILAKVSLVSDAETRISHIISRLALRVLTRPTGSRIDAADIVDATSPAPVRKFSSAIADGVENAIVLSIGSGDLAPGYLLRFEDDDQPTHERYPAQILLTLWKEAVQREAKVQGGGKSAMRAGRLLRDPSDFVVGMGLRALRIAIAAEPSNRIASEVFAQALSREEVLTQYFLEGELFPLLSENWETLPLETRAKFERSWTKAAETVSRETVHVRDRLASIRSYLGASSLLRLKQVEDELGEAVLDRSLPELGAMWVGPESPIPESQLSNLSLPHILSLMRYTPGPARGEWKGPSPEGLARALVPTIPKRLQEWLEALPVIGEEVPYYSVIQSVISGLSEAFKQKPGDRTDDSLRRVLLFFDQVLRRNQAGRFQDSDEWESGSSSQLVGAIADWIEGMHDWISSSSEGPSVLPFLESALNDPEPTPEFEAEYGGDNMNPPTLALNVTRGKGLRAALALLSDWWRNEPPNDAGFRAALETLVVDRVREESSPGVRSIFGTYLPQLIMYWPDLWEEEEANLLPHESVRSASWASVFTTYLLFYPARSNIAPKLLSHYEFAIESLTDPDAIFLRSHAQNLLTHLLALSLFNEDEESWRELLRRALEVGSDDGVSGMLRNLESAVKSQSVDLPFSFIQWLAGEIVGRSRRTGDRDASLSALMNLVIATELPLQQVGGMLLDLLRIGPAPDIDDLLEYLESRDPQPSGLGAQILASALLTGERSGMFYSITAISEAVSRYADEFPSEMQPIVDSLGWDGVFEVEAAARVIYRGLSSAAK